MVTLIKTLMSLRGVNQTRLARTSGVSITAISRFLNNTSDLRSNALLKVLSALGTDINSVMKKEIHKALGHDDDHSIGEDIRCLLEKASPITRKTITSVLILNFKKNKNTDARHRIARLKKYRDSIKTVNKLTF